MAFVTQPRITNQAAVMAVQAMIGDNCGEEFAIDIIEVVRPHLESPIQFVVSDLRRQLAEATAIIASLQQANA